MPKAMPTVSVHRNAAFLQSLDEVPDDEECLVAAVCLEIHLRMCDMQVAFAQIRGEDADSG